MRKNRMSSPGIMALLVAILMSWQFGQTTALAKYSGGGRSPSVHVNHSVHVDHTPAYHSPASSPAPSRPSQTWNTMPTRRTEPAARTATQTGRYQGGGRQEQGAPARPATDAQPQTGRYTGMKRDGTPVVSVGQTATQGSPQIKRSAMEQRMSDQASKQASREALNAYRDQRSQFKNQGSPVAASPMTRQYVSKTIVVHHWTPERLHDGRASFYGGWHPVYVNNRYYSSSYGLWDTMALWFMLDHIRDQQYAMMYYSHRNDPDMMAWRAQAEQEAANNAVLRQRLAVMDARMGALENQGVTPQQGYVPRDMGDLALSDQTLQNPNVADQQSATSENQQQVQQAQQPVQQPIEEHHGWPTWLKWTLGILFVGAVYAGYRYWKL